MTNRTIIALAFIALTAFALGHGASEVDLLQLAIALLQ